MGMRKIYSSAIKTERYLNKQEAADLLRNKEFFVIKTALESLQDYCESMIEGIRSKQENLQADSALEEMHPLPLDSMMQDPQNRQKQFDPANNQDDLVFVMELLLDNVMTLHRFLTISELMVKDQLHYWRCPLSSSKHLSLGSDIESPVFEKFSFLKHLLTQQELDVSPPDFNDLLFDETYASIPCPTKMFHLLQISVGSFEDLDKLTINEQAESLKTLFARYGEAVCTGPIPMNPDRVEPIIDFFDSAKVKALLTTDAGISYN